MCGVVECADCGVITGPADENFRGYLMRVMFIGDVVGAPGRRALAALLPELRREHKLDVIVANGENAAAGRGLTMRTAKDMFNAGVDIISSGNHIWDQREFIEELDSDAPILRPANYPPGSPGVGMRRC